MRQVFTATILLILSLAGVLIVLPVPPVRATLSCSASQSTTFQICGPIESLGILDDQPSVIQSNDGTLKMAWVGMVATNFDIYFATGSYNSTAGWTWTGGAIVASQAGTNIDPALVQLQNGTIYLFFAFKPLISLHGNYQLYFLKNNAGAWSRTYTSVPLSNPMSLSSAWNDTSPTATVGKDGTLWLVWSRDNSTAAGTSAVMRQLWYKTLSGNVWSTEQPFTSANDVNWNYEPSVVAGKDGIIRVVYSRGVSANDVFDIYSMNYSKTTGWGQPIQLTTQTTTDDVYPSIMQDRNGTLWVFYADNVNNGGNNTAFQLYDIYSTKGGGGIANWSAPTDLTLTSGCSTICSDTWQASAVQSTADDHIWVFYAANPTETYQIWALESTKSISPVHDVSMSLQPITTQNVPCSSLAGQTCFYQGGFNNSYMYLSYNGIYKYGAFVQPATIPVNVNLQNLGDYTENFTVTLNAVNKTSTSLGTQRVILAPGGSTVVTFNFNTKNVKPAEYSFSGNITLPSSEVVTVGNKQDGIISSWDPIHLLPLGDIDQNGAVTITDVSVVFFDYGFGCTSTTSCSSRYISAEWGSLDNTGTIDIVDAGVVAFDYGTYT
jgi:hypothetical protein